MADPKVTFGWNRPVEQIIRDATGGDKTALFMAETWHRLYSPFVPMDTGTLDVKQTTHSAENGVGIISHNAPYAHRLYNGNGYSFRKTEHPLATSHWDEAAKQAGKGKQLAAETQAFIRGGAKRI